MHCPAIGIPYPNITWYHNGLLLTEQDSPHIEYLQDGRQLKLNRVLVNDTGVYECNAVNEAGSDHLSIRVDVLGKMEIKFVIFVKSL